MATERDTRLKCIYGNTVTLLNLRNNETSQYELVHYNDEKLKENKISNYTPIGKAIWAKHEGESAVVMRDGVPAETLQIVKIANT